MNVTGRVAVNAGSEEVGAGGPSMSRPIGRPRKYSTVGVDVGDRSPRRGARPARRAQRHHEAVGRAFVGAAQLGVADQPFEMRFTGDSGRCHDSRPPARGRRGPASWRRPTSGVEHAVVVVEHAAEGRRSSSLTSPNSSGVGVAQVVVRDGVEPRQAHGDETRRPADASSASKMRRCRLSAWTGAGSARTSTSLACGNASTSRARRAGRA